MNREQAELVRRIREFQFDDPDAERPFSARLAQEQDWSREFTARAIDEYRRFCVLATETGHPVCPSKAVDEVWHLHLLYTQNYWKRFCGEVLKRPLHHEPSRGGGAEFEKHREMYAQTLQSYRAIFGEEPPADIWPPVDAVFGNTSGPCGDTKSSVRDSSPLRSRIRRRWPWFATGGALSVLPLVNSGLFAQFGDLLDLRGPDFLLLYAALFCVATSVALYMRSRARRADSPAATSIPKLDAYEIAYLAGGERRVVNTAVMQLVNAEHLKIDTITPPRFSPLSPPPVSAHIIERTVYRLIAKERGGELQAVHRQVGSLCEKMLDRLRESGLVVSRRSNWNGTAVPILVMAALAAFGGAKIIVGVSRHRPVGFLVLACIGTMFAAVAIFGRRLHRTPTGDRELSALQKHFSDLRDVVAERGNSKTDSQFPLAVGLFGMGLLATTTMAGLANAIEKSARGGGTGCGTGCGGGGGCGTGCGGGGGCGAGCGGGGCGGGCGGCSG